MDLWQQQTKVFSTSSPETIHFSIPASRFYVVTVWALHKMQKLWHLSHPGRGLTSRADSHLWHGAAAAPQITALCKGHLGRSCEKLCWGSPSLCLGAAGKLRAWATSQLCLAMDLAVPDLVTWLSGLTLCCHVATVLCDSQWSVIWTQSPLLYMLLSFCWCGTAALVGEVTVPCLPCCHPQFVAHFPPCSSPTLAVPQRWEHIVLSAKPGFALMHKSTFLSVGRWKSVKSILLISKE